MIPNNQGRIVLDVLEFELFSSEVVYIPCKFGPASDQPQSIPMYIALLQCATYIRYNSCEVSCQVIVSRLNDTSVGTDALFQDMLKKLAAKSFSAEPRALPNLQHLIRHSCACSL